MALTDLKIRKSKKPRERPYKFYDSMGLFVLVNANGSKLWRQKYTQDGKERLMTHVFYPSVSLQDARQKRDDIRTQLDEG